VTGEGIAQAIEYGSMVGPLVALALRGEARLESWSQRFRESRLGRDLAIRERLGRHFFGQRRPELEHMLVAGPSMMRAGCRHFGALPMEPVSMGASIARLGVYLLRGILAP